MIVGHSSLVSPVRLPMMTARVVLPPHRHLAPGLPPSRLLRPKGAVPEPTRVDDTRQNCDLCGTLSSTAVDAQRCTRNYCQLAAHQIARTPPCCTCSFLSCMPVKCCFHERVACGTCSSLHSRAPFSTECATKQRAVMMLVDPPLHCGAAGSSQQPAIFSVLVRRLQTDV